MLVRTSAHAPAAIFDLDQAAPALVAVFYLALLALTGLLSRPAEQRPAWTLREALAAQWLPTARVASLALGAALAWSYCFSLPDGRLIEGYRAGCGARR